MNDGIQNAYGIISSGWTQLISYKSSKHKKLYIITKAIWPCRRPFRQWKHSSWNLLPNC